MYKDAKEKMNDQAIEKNSRSPPPSGLERKLIVLRCGALSSAAPSSSPPMSPILGGGGGQNGI